MFKSWYPPNTGHESWMRTGGSFILKFSKLLEPKVINKIEYLPINQAHKTLLAEFFCFYFNPMLCARYALRAGHSQKPCPWAMPQVGAYLWMPCSLSITLHTLWYDFNTLCVLLQFLSIKLHSNGLVIFVRHKETNSHGIVFSKPEFKQSAQCNVLELCK